MSNKQIKIAENKITELKNDLSNIQKGKQSQLTNLANRDPLWCRLDSQEEQLIQRINDQIKYKEVIEELINGKTKKPDKPGKQITKPEKDKKSK